MTKKDYIWIICGFLFAFAVIYGALTLPLKSFSPTFEQVFNRKFKSLDVYVVHQPYVIKITEWTTNYQTIYCIYDGETLVETYDKHNYLAGMTNYARTYAIENTKITQKGQKLY